MSFMDLPPTVKTSTPIKRRYRLATVISAALKITSGPGFGGELLAVTKEVVTFVGDGEALYSDALGEPGSDGATYAGMVRHNARILAKYLAP